MTVWERIPPTRDALVMLRLKALRRGIWFRELKNEERKIVELTIRVVEKIRSHLLAKVLSQIVRTLLDKMEGEVSRLMRTVGRLLANKMSKIAQSWGNESATQWVDDQNFIQYLAITALEPSTC